MVMILGNYPYSDIFSFRHMMHNKMGFNKCSEIGSRNIKLPYMTLSLLCHIDRFSEISEFAFIKNGNLVTGT